jgi:hypothetical protein
MVTEQCVTTVSYYAEIIKKVEQVKNGNILNLTLKGQCHEIFDPRFFSSNNPL